MHSQIRILSTCLEFDIPVQLVLLYMPWFVLILIYLMHYMLLVDSLLILVRSIGGLFNGF